MAVRSPVVLGLALLASVLVASLASVANGLGKGILYGTYTVELQSPSQWSAENAWLRANHTEVSFLAQSVRVVEVGWAPTATIESHMIEILRVWTFAEAVPIITWMPYPYKTWTSKTPNDDISSGKYDDYIDQFLGNLSKQFSYGQKEYYLRKAYLRFAPAPNGNWFPWSPTCPPCGSQGQNIEQSAASFKRMWNYVIKKVREPKYNLTSDVLQVMYDSATAWENGKPKDFAPDMNDTTTRADWFSVTGINWGNTLPGNQWVSPKTLFKPTLEKFQTLSPNTPRAIVSAATTSAPLGTAAKNDWIADLCTLVTSMTNMFTYHNADGSTDLAMFGGAKGVINFTTPFAQDQYRTYPAWRTCVMGPNFVPRNYTSTTYINSTTFWGQ